MANKGEEKRDWWATFNDVASKGLTFLKRRVENAFFIFFVVVLVIAIFYFGWTWACGEPPFLKGLVPIGSVDSWEDFRNVTFGIAGVIGGAFGLFQLYNSAVRTRLNNEDVAIKREAERNERFVSAAELLKDEDASVRMAGVYALERLALDNEANYDETVVKVLSGFVRERTNRSGYASRPKSIIYKRPAHKYTEEEIARANSGGWNLPAEPISAAIEALSNICRNRAEIRKTDPTVSLLHPNLRGANLARLEANGFFMVGWRLSRANLQAAWFQNAALRGARLNDANLKNARLESCDMRKIEKFGANLDSALLTNADLSRCDISKAANVSPTQIESSIWATYFAPKLPATFETEEYDKRWCTDDNDMEKLHPALLDDDGNFKGVPYDFRERREKELGIGPTDDEEE